VRKFWILDRGFCNPNGTMNEEDLKQRTKTFALRILKLAVALPRSIEADVIRRQIVRSGTSVAASYRSSCRAKSGGDFAYKLSVVEEEADETALWLELIVAGELLPAGKVEPLLREAGEITAIMVASLRTARGPRTRSNPKSKIQNQK
jgi:four helix bundle protein